MEKRFLVLSITLLFAACSAKTFAPTDQQLSSMQRKVPGITVEEAQMGYKLYAAKCARCHQLYHPEKYTIAQWDTILPKMFPKAKVADEEQKRLLGNYVRAMSR